MLQNIHLMQAGTGLELVLVGDNLTLLNETCKLILWFL